MMALVSMVADKGVGVISNNEEVHVHTPFKSKPQPKLKLFWTPCKTGQCLCERDFCRGGQCNPLQAAVAAGGAGSALAAYLLK